jgi:hypothetical protein
MNRHDRRTRRARSHAREHSAGGEQTSSVNIHGGTVNTGGGPIIGRDKISIAQASFELQSALRDYPKLELVLIEPKEARWTIPAARSDIDDDVEERLVAEAAAKGIPSREWLADALAPIHDRIAKAKLDLDADTDIDEHARDEFERYALAIQEWYDHVVRNLIRKHKHDTFIARSVPIILEIRNNGRLPAEQVKISFSLEPRLSVDEIPSKGYFSTAVPVPPSNFLPQEFCDAAIRPPSRSWYSEQQTPNKYVPYGISVIPDGRDEDTGRKIFRSWFPELQHEQSKKLRAICVSFGYDAAFDLNIRYKLHATNQPEDTIGAIDIQITEEQKAS